MKIGNLITKYRKEANLTIDELVALSGVPKGTINKMIAGTTKAPTLENVRSIAHALGKTLDDFDTSLKRKTQLDHTEQQLIKKYRALDKHGKKMVDIVIEEETDRMNIDKTSSEIVPMRKIKKFLSPSAAGSNNYFFADGYEEIEVPADTKGDFIVTISGDSMEPYIKDGQDVFVSIGAEMNEGDVGIFLYDNATYCKQYFESFGFIYLLSLNRDRADMDVIVNTHGGLDVKCFGKVLLDKRPPKVKV